MKKLLIGLLILFLIAQFFRPSKNLAANGEEHYQELATRYNIDADTQDLLVRSCYDCHSAHTQYPWYAEITPINYYLADHVEEGKEHFDFAEFDSYDLKKLDHKLEEMVEEIEEDKMPLSEYTNIHRKAIVSEEEKAILIDWANNYRAQLTNNE